MFHCYLNFKPTNNFLESTDFKVNEWTFNNVFDHLNNRYEIFSTRFEDYDYFYVISNAEPFYFGCRSVFDDPGIDLPF